MSTSHLVVLPTPTAPESPVEKIRRLQSEARELARQHLDQLGGVLHELSRVSGDIADGGELYPVGARELARRLAEESAKHAFTLSGIVERA